MASIATLGSSLAFPDVGVREVVRPWSSICKRIGGREAGIFVDVQTAKLLVPPKSRQHPPKRDREVRGVRVTHVASPVGFSKDGLKLKDVMGSEEASSRKVEDVLTIPP
jgi:hypothetical protein